MRLSVRTVLPRAPAVSPLPQPLKVVVSRIVGRGHGDILDAGRPRDMGRAVKPECPNPNDERKPVCFRHSGLGIGHSHLHAVVARVQCTAWQFMQAVCQSGLMGRIANPLSLLIVGSNPTAAFFFRRLSKAKTGNTYLR